ncbi:hypothetical protein NQZ68_033861 [Dissostichus eleginoides]|nr:hypothetical protein NQZ68_033861 [Dissostichus eleginoides]
MVSSVYKLTKGAQTVTVGRGKQAAGGHDVHDFPKLFFMWTHQTTAHFPTLCQSISDELGPEEPYMASDGSVNLHL